MTRASRLCWLKVSCPVQRYVFIQSFGFNPVNHKRGFVLFSGNRSFAYLTKGFVFCFNDYHFAVASCFIGHALTKHAEIMLVHVRQ